MDVTKLLEPWCVILLPHVCEPCSLEAWSIGTMLYDWGRKVRLPLCMWASADLSGATKAWIGKRSSLLIVCVYELLECVEPWLSLTLSFFLSLSLFFSLFFLSHSFSQASQGWHLLVTMILLWMAGTCSKTLSDFPHTWTFVWKSSVQCQGLLLSVFPLQRASKCSADAVLMFSDIVCPLKWLGPRIPEGAYYA